MKAICLLALFWFPAQHARAKTIVVVAPHPDDEALCCSGIIYRARRLGDVVYVIVLTNGDYVGGTSKGYERERETINAMKLLGVSEQHVIFLGYGDGSMLTIYESSNPYQVYQSAARQTQTYGNRGLGGADYHYYLYRTHGPYNRLTMMQDITAALTNLHPDDIYTTSVVDGHSDHEAAGMAVLEAVRNVEAVDSRFQPRLHETVIHAPGGGNWPGAFAPTVPFSAPQGLAQTPLDWSQIESIPVPSVMQDPNPSTNLKHQVINAYRSQVKYDPKHWLFGFVKQNEYFWVTTPSLDVAQQAKVTDSSEDPSGNNAGAKAVDGEVPSQLEPYQPVRTAPITDHEWVTDGQLGGAWIQLHWSHPVTIDEVVLSDRPDPNQNVLAGTLTFSDRSQISVGALPIYGTPYPITFPSKTITWVKFIITQAQGTATGLGEFDVLAPSTPVPIAVTFRPYDVTADKNAQGNVTLSAPSVSGNVTVALTTDSGSVNIPASVSVPQGKTNGTFTLTVPSSAQAGPADVTASLNGTSQNGILEIVSPTHIVTTVLLLLGIGVLVLAFFALMARRR